MLPPPPNVIEEQAHRLRTEILDLGKNRQEVLAGRPGACFDHNSASVRAFAQTFDCAFQPTEAPPSDEVSQIATRGKHADADIARGFL